MTIIDFRYLDVLTTTFNEVISDCIEDMKPMADGCTTVPLKSYVGDAVFNILNKVSYYFCFDVCSILLIHIRQDLVLTLRSIGMQILLNSNGYPKTRKMCSDTWWTKLLKQLR